MKSELENRTNALSLAGGAILIGLGLMFLAGQVFRIDFGHYLWPFFIIVPGMAILTMGLLNDHTAGEAMSMAGGALTMAGLLMAYQNLTGHWASWSYAWALVGPTGVGLGLLAFGLLKGRQDKINAGRRLAMIGLVIFLAGAVFFELIIGISGFGLGRLGWPLLLIGLGVIGIIRAFANRRDL